MAEKMEYTVMKFYEYQKSSVLFRLFQASPHQPLAKLTKFHLEPLRLVGTKTYSSGTGHMTNVAAMIKMAATPPLKNLLLQKQLTDGLGTCRAA